jgi:hypothetical protein
MPFLIDYICDNCDYETSDFRDDKKRICPDCKTVLRLSTMQNQKNKNVRGFRHVDKGN